MNGNESSISTGGGTFIGGNVNTGGGDFVGRDKTVQLIQKMEEKNVEGDYVERQEITQVFLVVPDAQEAIVEWLTDQEGIDKRFLKNPRARTAPEHIDRQIEEVEAAQQEAAAKGVPITSQTAYQLGILAAYRRDYEVALEYLRQATQKDPMYADAFEAIAWIQQYRAVDDISRRDYDAAMNKLEAAHSAATQTDPLDARALALRGYIAKTLAQISEAKHEEGGREKYYEEAARLFEHAAQLDPNDPSAQNGLGNVQYARGNLDAAIKAYKNAISLAPSYTAAHHDLAIAYEAKMKAAPSDATEWCQKALAAWQKTYHLAPKDPGFSADYIFEIGRRIRWLEGQCG